MTPSTRFSPTRVKTLCLALFALSPALACAGVAGRVQFVAGDVRIVDAQGREQPLRKGQEVNEGDTVLSASGASAQLRMIDGGILALRPGTQLKIVGYQFNGKEDGSENASFSLLKGGLRAITGIIGKTNKERYKIDTPSATIGIRGTDHEPVVVLPAPDGALAAAAPGTYDKVNVGATALTTQAGTTLVAANQVGFAASPMQMPVILPVLPDFYRSVPVAQAARAGQPAKEGKEEASPAAAREAATAATTEAASDGAASATPAAPAATLTAVDAAGNSLDLSRQTITSASGEAQALAGGLAPGGAQLPKPGVELMASYPSPVLFNDGNQPTDADFRFPAMFFHGGPSTGLTRDAAGNVIRVLGSAGSDAFDSRSSLAQSGSVVADLGTHAATGLSWGRWQGGTVSAAHQYFDRDAKGAWGMGADNAAGEFVIGLTQTDSAALGAGSLHWITGGMAGPDFLPRVLTGSASYAAVGGTRPTDTRGNVGTFGSAALNVNFATQMASASVSFSIAGDSWSMQSDPMHLRGTHFSSYDGCDSPCPPKVQLTRNGASFSDAAGAGSGAFGSINGMLTGQGVNGAALQYAVQTHAPKSGGDPASGQPGMGIEHNLIQGAAALAGPAQDVNTPFRVVDVSDHWMFGRNPDAAFDTDGGVYVGINGPDGKPLYRGSIEGEPAPVARLVDSAGGLFQFVGSAYGYDLPDGTKAPAHDRDLPATIRIGSALNRDVGAATIAGATISWGRWESGTVDIYSYDGSTKLGTIDNANRSIHWLASSALTAAYFSAPLTGTATYVLAGNTRPTDLNGNVGTLSAATLAADFSNARVDVGLSVDFAAPSNTSTWTMTASNIPLAGDGGFKSSSALNGIGGIAHSATCGGPSCGSQTVGHLNGHLLGAAQGAVLSYNMTTGSSTAAAPDLAPLNAVTGIVVMKR